MEKHPILEILIKNKWCFHSFYCQLFNTHHLPMCCCQGRLVVDFSDWAIPRNIWLNHPEKLCNPPWYNHFQCTNHPIHAYSQSLLSTQTNTLKGQTPSAVGTALGINTHNINSPQRGKSIILSGKIFRYRMLWLHIKERKRNLGKHCKSHFNHLPL